jgi:hypothetical protein
MRILLGRWQAGSGGGGDGGKKKGQKVSRVQKLLLCQKKFRQSAKEKLHTAGIMLLKPFLLSSISATARERRRKAL